MKIYIVIVKTHIKLCAIIICGGVGGSQQYPQGIQEKYNSFSSRNPITEKGKELEFPEGAGGGKGEPGVPPSGSALGKQKNFPDFSSVGRAFDCSCLSDIKMSSVRFR